jgi:hypothetical protein
MKKVASFLMIAILCGISFSTRASDGKNEKFMNKHREIISELSPDDWYTLAASAESCIKKNIINKEVAEWIDRSLEIKKTAYNLEVKGDYYIKNKLPDKAGECYLEAIKVGIEEDDNFDSSELQEKIARIINLET